MPNPNGRTAKSFASNIHFGPVCWEWMGGKTPSGYAQAEAEVRRWQEEAADRLGEAAEAKRERTELHAKLAQAERDRASLLRRIDELNACVRLAERERDEAVAKERARCAAWAKYGYSGTRESLDGLDGIRAGKPAPGTK